MKPVVLIPGIGGCALVNKNQASKTVFGKPILDNRWVNFGIISTPQYHKRWKDDMQKIQYITDPLKQRIIGMQTDEAMDVYDFGGTNGVKNLLPELDTLPPMYNHKLDEIFTHTYFGSLCDYLGTKGYIDAETLFGAPYDFRTILDPSVRLLYFAKLMRLIEQNHEPAVIVSHSFGGLLFKWFLGTMEPSWIKEHIHHSINVSVPYGGSLPALMCMMQGSHYIPFLRGMVKQELNKVSGIISCFPNTGTDPVIEFKDGKELYVQEYTELENQRRIPSLKVYNDLFSHGLTIIKKQVSVPSTFVYNNTTLTASFYNTSKDIYFRSRGDGVVTIDSLQHFKDMYDTSIVNEIQVLYGNHTSVLLSKELRDVVDKYI